MAYATTGDENQAQQEYSAIAGRERRPNLFWELPDCECGPDTLHEVCAWHSRMSPLPRGEEHEKESQRYFRVSSLAAKEINVKELYSRCAGLDVHKKTINVCIRQGKGKKLELITGLFGTFTGDLERLYEMLRSHKVRQVAIESTGVYWMPVSNVLERAAWKCNLIVVNPQHVHAIPGKKTDQSDCQWLAELAQHGLLRGSFIPPPEIRELRDLTRQRTHVQSDRNRAINRLARLLETANFKLGSVVSNLVGKTGWLILQAIADGETAPERLAEKAQGSLQYKKAELAQALRGYATEHFRWLLRQLLDELARLDRKVNELDQRIGERMQPYADLIRRLTTIPGVKETTAWTLIAELGTNMNQFPSADHAASWAGLCPGNSESAGKRQSGRTRKGDRYLRRMLIQNAWAISHKKDCFLTALYYRVAARRGAKRAAMAVAHRVLMIAYHIMRDGTEYREVGGDYYDRKNPERTARRLTKRLEQIGYKVVLTKESKAQTPADIPSRKTLTGTTRWELFRTLRQKGQPPATPDQCRKCSAWGIPCFHARNAKLQAPEKTNSADSTG